jgi:cytochrome P450
MSGDVLDVDLASRSFRRNPFPTLARLREAGPVVRVKLPFYGRVWLATTHAAVNEVLRDERTFVRDARNAGKRDRLGFGWWLPRPLRVLGENMLSSDGPDHRRLRHLVDQAFTRHSVEALRPRIAGLCDALLDRMAGSGRVDLIGQFARPLPLTVICELMGLPPRDRPRFSRWVADMVSVDSLLGLVLLLPALIQLTRYFGRHLRECRRRPRPGLMTALVQAEQDGDRLSEEELLSTAFLLLFAGHETTVHLIGGGVLALLERPEQKGRLLSDWSLAPSAVEELLRFVSPVQLSEARHVGRDLEFHGRALRRGDYVTGMLAAANADPARFVDPERLDVARSPNPHVAFGTGTHFCVGAQLARVETQVALERLFTRFPRLSLAAPASTLRYGGAIGFRALAALPVRLT